MSAAVDERISALEARVVAGEVRGVARALRLVDDRDPLFVGLLKRLYVHTGRAYVLGVTGTPGAGKSTLVDRLVTGYRARGDRVAVVAVDPTSPYSGGAILGDRIRMQRHFLDEGVFIRSLATRGHLGGLTRSAGDVIHVLDAAGFDVVIVETVGVGQDELEVTRLAHTTVVVMAPGLGDDIQAIKAGILEVADVFAVNKADRDGADATVRDLEQMVALGHDVARGGARARGHSAAMAQKATAGASETGWSPPILKTVASKGEGIDTLLESCDAHRLYLSEPERSATLRRARVAAELTAIFHDTVRHAADDRVRDALEQAVDAISTHEDDPYSVSERLLEQLFRRQDEA